MLKISKNISNGMMTGYRELDELTEGIHESELIFIGGRPAMGKKALALGIARHVSVELKIPTVLFSLNLSKEQMVNYIEISEWEDMSNLIIYDNFDVSIDEICLECRNLKQDNKIGLIIIDYLQLIGDGKINTSNKKVFSEITTKLKKLATELKVPIILLSQLSRNIDHRKNKRPVLTDLHILGDIEKDIDTVIYIYRNDYYLFGEEYFDEKDITEIGEIIIPKQLNNNVGTIELSWNARKRRFESLFVE